ncbi:BglG family transcription antiterminator [Bacillus sp. sid0103]|uniref:BglG family transcription antiterminator n=1 Tax=Bacillus sp. sid0103 TaxID=2856337 RepID=UPI001C490E03|nr:BglG family transcription antiterminator [Bacillus sp. sid0103]MBV7508751.1 BglG family transcription antiterminator [Bacillus sp. sid0103]
MYISARERQILEILLTESDELTVKDLADQIGVSGRTVHRDLKNIEDILKEYDLSLLKKSGVGVQITGSKDKIGELELFLFNLFHTEYTPDERQTIILCGLLESDGPVKLLGLANDLNVTIATVSADLTKLEERLQTFGLALIRRRGYGVEIEGDESAKRRAMSNLITEYIDESEILSLARETIQKRSNQQINTISERLLGLVEKKKLLTVEKIVETTIQDLPFNMADSAYIGLVVHLALAVERIQKGEGIKINQSYLKDHQSSKEYKFAEKIVSQLEQVFQIKIPEAEVAYITMHLKGAKLRHDNEYLIEDSSLQVAIKSRNLIEMVGKRAGIDLTGNRSLFEGLVVHLKPALYRIKQRMGISNPLLDKIKRDYAELFSTVKQAVEQVFHEFYVPDEEIGYLVMHFGAAILANKEIVQLKTLVICSSGIGTSKMLATRLQQEFPELKDIQNVSVMEFKRMKTDTYQLIISTIPIPDYHSDYILVSPILNKDEIEKIRSFINEQIIFNGSEHKFSVSFMDRVHKKKASVLIEEMNSIQGYAQTIAVLLEGFELRNINDSKTAAAIIKLASEELFANQKIDNIEAVVDAISEREKLGGLGIPDTSMALFHARSPYVITPTFTIYRTQQPIEVVGMDQKQMEIRSILLMLSPQETAESSLEVLSYLSSLLIESEESIALFQSDQQEEILAYLTARFDQFFTEKLNNIRSV